MDLSLSTAEPAALTEIDHQALSALPEFATREEIEAFGAMMLAAEPQHGIVDLGLVHHHADKLYGRSGVLRRHNFLAGLPHKQGCINVCIGDITVAVEGGPHRRLTGAHILTSDARLMRVGFAHQDTTWLTVHANLTGSTDLAVIEEALVEQAHRLMTRRTAPRLRAA